MSKFARVGVLVVVCMSLGTSDNIAQDVCRDACRTPMVADSLRGSESRSEELGELPTPEVVVVNEGRTFTARSADHHPALRPVELDDFQFTLYAAENVTQRIECVQWRIDGKVHERMNPHYGGTSGLLTTTRSIAGDTQYYWAEAGPGRHTVEGRYLFDNSDRRIWSPWSAPINLEVRLPNPPVPIAIGNMGQTPTSIIDGRLAIRITTQYAAITLKGIIGSAPIVECLDSDIPEPIRISADPYQFIPNDKYVLNLSNLQPGTYELVFRNSDVRQRWTSAASKSIRIEFDPQDRDSTYQPEVFHANFSRIMQSTGSLYAMPSSNNRIYASHSMGLEGVLRLILCGWQEAVPPPPGRSETPPPVAIPLENLVQPQSVCVSSDTNGGFSRLVHPQPIGSHKCCDEPKGDCDGEGLGHTVWFEQPAHFSRSEFDMRGAKIAREGAVIYEGMRFNWDTTGKYQVVLLVEIPAVRTELRLQLTVKCNNSPWQTITLPPFVLDPDKAGSDFRAGVFKVAHIGFSPTLAHYSMHGAPNALQIRRAGIARFGFGIDR